MSSERIFVSLSVYVEMIALNGFTSSDVKD